MVAACVFVTLACGRVSSPTPQSGSLSIRGVVTDRKFGQPVPHAVIWAWRGSKRRCSSPAEFVAPADSAGWFALSVPEAGRYFVCARAIGYAWRGAKVTLPSDSARIIKLRLPYETYYLGP